MKVKPGRGKIALRSLNQEQQEDLSHSRELRQKDRVVSVFERSWDLRASTLQSQIRWNVDEDEFFSLSHGCYRKSVVNTFNNSGNKHENNYSVSGVEHTIIEF